MNISEAKCKAIRSVGPYTVLVDNGPARQLNIAQQLQSEGELWGDPFEVSSLRREDYQVHLSSKISSFHPFLIQISQFNLFYEFKFLNVSHSFVALPF